MTKWLSGRKVFTVMSFGTITYLKIINHLGDEWFGIITLGLAAGHHLPDILAKWPIGGKNVGDRS